MVAEGNIESDIFGMALKKIYTPSVLDQMEEIEDWLRELAIWQCVTDFNLSIFTSSARQNM